MIEMCQFIQLAIRQKVVMQHRLWKVWMSKTRFNAQKRAEWPKEIGKAPLVK